MRLIQFMHPEHQINIKLVGNNVLANAEIYNEVAKEQLGSRKHHKLGLPVLNKILIGDLFCLTCCVGCYGMNDAKGCFDRIEHPVALLILMHFGVA